KKPPSDSDINTETLDLLRDLYFLAFYFRAYADPKGTNFIQVGPGDKEPEPDDLAEFEGPVLIGDLKPMLKNHLLKIERIDVCTEIWYTSGGQARHRLLGGAISFSARYLSKGEPSRPGGRTV